MLIYRKIASIVAIWSVLSNCLSHASQSQSNINYTTQNTFMINDIQNSVDIQTEHCINENVESFIVADVNDYTVKYAYNTLTKQQQEVYKLIFDSISNGINKINLEKFDLSATDIQKIFWACDFDNPRLLTIKTGFSYNYDTKVHYITVNSGRTPKQTKEILKKINSKINDILIEAQKLQTDYEKVKFFHDWIVRNTDYINDTSKFPREIDGPFLYNVGICEGYSKTFEYLCQLSGINCICVGGKANDGDHMWNMVEVDGNWYHIDLTWDDPFNNSSIVSHKYFLVSDTQISRNHQINNKFELPIASSSYKA